MERSIIARDWRLREIPPTSRLGSDLLTEAAGGSWTDSWLEIAEMPAMVHDVLLKHRLIEEPWLPGRAESCRWVAERDWVYAVRFPVANPAGRLYLCFEALDTIVDVYLNGSLIARQSNAYLPLRVDVSGLIRGENSLVLHFHSVFDLSDGQPRRIKLVDGDPQQPVRRQNSNYGTYLGPHPYYSRVGVYDDVALESICEAGIDRLIVGSTLDESLRRGAAEIVVDGEAVSGRARVRARLVAPTGDEITVADAPVAVADGRYRNELTLRVDDPLLWWPRGQGDQPLYRVEVELVVGERVVQRESRTVGFRRITMPEPLQFFVNGRSVRLWGGNWVSPDWVTTVWNQEKAVRLFDIAEQANFNSFRVWGVVEAPRDAFYEEADRRGFLLWQDFTDLPFEPDESSRLACRAESARLIARLKHHPSILMWCGGNEEAMWNESEFGGPGGPWPGRVPAEEDVAEVCRQLDPERFYLPNSPYHGIDSNDPKAWDTHGYTNIWYVPGYDDLVFASEDTRIAAPPLHSMKRFFDPNDLWPADYSPVYTHESRFPWPDSWAGYTTSSSWQKTGPVEQFHDATNPAELVYRLGMAEAVYYKEMIERQRRGRPSGERSDRRVCGGYLVWKFNDSWPEIYSAKVDYFLEPYLPYYAIRHAFSPVLVSIDVGVHVWAWVVNDTPKAVEGTLRISLFRLSKNVVEKEIVRDVRVEPGRSIEVVRLDEAGIGTFYRDSAILASLTDAHGAVIATAHVLGDIERHLKFPDARLAVEIRADGALVIETDRYARAVSLTGDAAGDEFGWLFEDNWFDLMPGETKVVRILGQHHAGQVTARAWHSPHATTVDWRRQRADEGDQEKTG